MKLTLTSVALALTLSGCWAPKEVPLEAVGQALQKSVLTEVIVQSAQAAIGSKIEELAKKLLTEDPFMEIPDLRNHLYSALKVFQDSGSLASVSVEVLSKDSIRLSFRIVGDQLRRDICYRLDVAKLIVTSGC